MTSINERLHSFLVIAADDNRLSSAHVCMYVVLCSFAASTVEIYFSISRQQIMRLMKIRGIATYHKIIRELHAFGYIDYLPSYHPVNGSLIRLNDFQSLIQQ